MPNRSKSKAKHLANPSTTPISSSPDISQNNVVNIEDPLYGLISRNAHVHSISEIDSNPGDFSATLWMPNVAMLSASFSASQLLAISVCVTYASRLLDPLQVESLEKLCSTKFGIVVKDGMKDEPGHVSVTASAWPCSKLKDGVRLSRQVAYALGSPALGTKICVCAINFSELENLGRSKFSGRAWVQAILQESQEISLRWCPFRRDTSSTDLGSFGHFESALGTTSLVDKQSQSSIDVQTLPDHATGGLDGRNLGLQQTKKGGGTANKNEYWWLKSESMLTSILVNEDGRAKVLLERFSSCLLQGRNLLKGNFVAIPVCGQTCIFQVVGAKSFSPVDFNMSNEQQSSKIKGNKCSCEGFPVIFVAGSMTQVKLVPPVVQFANVKHAHMDAKEAVDGKALENAVPVTDRLEFHALGGLSEQITTLKEIIDQSLRHPERLMRLGLQPPHGILLHGPPGTGKTSLAITSAVEAGIKLYSINGPEIITEYYGESEAALRAVFAAAQKSAPSMVFIDELDAIAPQRTEVNEDLGQRMVGALLTLMDGGNQELHRVLVIGATNRVEAIDPALRRAGRFDREIEIGVPSPSGRLEILLAILKRMNHKLDMADIETLAVATHGFVGADLMALCNEAALVALRRYVKNIKIDAQGPSPGLQKSYEWERSITISDQLMTVSGQLESLDLTTFTKTERSCNQDYSELNGDLFLKISMDDLEEAKTKVRPSAMREVMLEAPKVHWFDIGGQDTVKQQLKEAVEWPQKHHDAFSRIGVHPPRGVLLYGPPGCSKTLMARAVATEAGLNFIAVKGPELFSKWVGQSEKAVQSLFERARAASPSIVFFDELDGLAVTRKSGGSGVAVEDRVMSQLLVEMDGLSAKRGITVIAATNRPDKIDPALLRPGRFDRLLYVGPPDEEARLQIFKIHTKKMPCGLDVDKAALAAQTNGYTGADIVSICREAAIAVLEEDMNSQEVKMRHFNFALSKVQPSISGYSESLYKQFIRSMQCMSSNS